MLTGLCIPLRLSVLMNTKELLIGTYEGVNLYAIPDYPIYAASKCGRIYSQYLRRWILQRSGKQGYLKVGIQHVSGTQKTVKVHRIIALAFLEIPEGYEVDHINRVKTDNNVSNLRCVTSSSNKKNKVGLGFVRKGNKFVSIIKHDGHKIYLGTFTDKDEATSAYLRKKHELCHILS